MNRIFIVPALLLLCFSSLAFSQVPVNIAIQILKAEDSRRYDTKLEDLMMSSPNAEIRKRAALAAGRIGNENAIVGLAYVLYQDNSVEVRAMAAFALGEIESIKGADVILKALKEPKAETRAVASVPSDFGFSILDFGFKTPVATAPGSDLVRARLVEAAGKIAAANPKDEKSKALGEAILDVLEAEDRKGRNQNRETVLLALTAVLRAKPEETDFIVAKFLTNLDPRIRADAANTLSRIRAKTANAALRAMLLSDPDPIARANAARALGAAEDKEAFTILLEAATEDEDSRVRVSAIRSLGNLKDAKAAEPLLVQGGKLLAAIKKGRKPNYMPAEQNEFIEIATALGRIVSNTDNQRADNLFRDFGKIDKGRSTEVYIARTRIGQRRNDRTESPELTNWRQYSTLAQIVGEFALIEPTSETGKQMKTEAPGILRPMAKAFAEADPVAEANTIMAGPDVLQAYARFKTEDLGEIARIALLNKDVQTRAAAAGILGDLPVSKENVEALKAAYPKSILNDKEYNDASLAILDALYKLDKKTSVDTFLLAAIASDYLVRKKAFELLADKELQAGFPSIAKAMEDAKRYKTREVLPYHRVSSTRLGQLFATDADYRRALSRRNGAIRAVLATEKGAFTIELLPEDAPLTVDNFIKLARANYFNGLEVHRVVPNFVMQDGDPRGDGNGGPGWSIRCEINMVPYERGAVGMALSGKDTGGSQWFVTHSPQPHLDGGYSVFGRVNETGMKVVDNIVRGDKIISVKIIEGSLPQKGAGGRKKKI